MCTSFAWIESSRRVLWLNSNIKLLEELWSSASLSQGNCILLPITKCHLKHSPKLWRLTDYTDSFTSGQAESTADGSIYQIPKWKEKWLLDKLECLLSQGQVGKGNVIRYSQRAEKARRKSVTFLLPFPGTGQELCATYLTGNAGWFRPRGRGLCQGGPTLLCMINAAEASFRC